MKQLHLFVVFVYVTCLTVTAVNAKTVFRRTDNKIGEFYKKVELPPEEVDPNVAPPPPQKIETIQPEIIINSGISGPEIIEAAVTAIPVEVVHVDDNELDIDVEAATDAPPVSSTSTPLAAETTTIKAEVEQSGLSKFCKCADAVCDCCREFRLPLLPIVRGPGCARVAFLGNDKMSVSLKYGDLTLASRTISGKRAKPICVGLPGGYSQFCGRVYGLQRSQENFKACLGFELRADDEVEAAVRVSCFKFGPSGLRVAESEPLPSELKDEDDDDDDDILGFGADADDEDEDEDEEDYEDEENDDEEVPVDADYGGFSLGSFLDELDDEDDEPPKKIATKASFVEPVIAETRHVQGKEETSSAVSESVTEEPQVVISTQSTKTNSKKNKTKKKKSSSDSTADYAIELITGILEFFN